MLRKVMPLAAWAYLAFIAFATLSPINLRPSLTSTEPHLIVVMEHVGAFTVLALLFSLAFPRLTFVCLVVFGSVIFLELLQFLVPTRDARLSDALDKFGGGAIGILAGYLSLSLGLTPGSDKIVSPVLSRGQISPDSGRVAPPGSAINKSLGKKASHNTNFPYLLERTS